MSSLGTALSFTTLIVAGLPGFLLYSILPDVSLAQKSLRDTYESAIFRFSPPGIAIFKWVKNSVLKTQLSRGSASCGELTPRENQSSLSVDVLTYLIAPSGMVRSDEIDS